MCFSSLLLQKTSPPKRVVLNTNAFFPHDSVDWLGGSSAGFAVGQSPGRFIWKGGLAGRPSMAPVTRLSGGWSWQVAVPQVFSTWPLTSLGLDWLPDGYLRAAVPRVREDLQSLTGPGIQDSQHHLPTFCQSKWETSSPRFRGQERNGHVCHGMRTGWQQLLMFRVPEAGQIQGLIPCTAP